MKILTFAEQRDQAFKKSAYECVKAARDIADQVQGEVIALVVGHPVRSLAPTLGGYGASRVVVVDHETLASYSTTAYATVVAEVAKAVGADVVMLPATAMGKDLGPRVAVKLDAGLAVDCTALNIENGEIVATRPVYAGKGLTDVKVVSPRKVFTLRPNVFTAGSPGSAEAPVEE
ncbi:MAG: electron transfer flavoprotein subunit alpha/FixB family protein, partial [Bacteroidota bacterium]